MLDRESPRGRSAEMSRRRWPGADDERRSSRTAITAVVAVGLALSTSLFLDPGESAIDGRHAPGGEHALGIPEDSKAPTTDRIGGRDVDGLSVMLQVSEILLRSAGTLPALTYLTSTGPSGPGTIYDHRETHDEKHSSAGILDDDTVSGVLTRMLPDFLAPPDVQGVMSSLTAAAAMPQPARIQAVVPEVPAVPAMPSPPETAVASTPVATPVPTTAIAAPAESPSPPPPVTVTTEILPAPTIYATPTPTEIPVSTVTETSSAPAPSPEADDPPRTIIEPSVPDDIDDQNDSDQNDGDEPGRDDEGDAGAEGQHGAGEGTGTTRGSDTDDDAASNADEGASPGDSTDE